MDTRLPRQFRKTRCSNSVEIPSFTLFSSERTYPIHFPALTSLVLISYLTRVNLWPIVWWILMGFAVGLPHWGLCLWWSLWATFLEVIWYFMSPAAFHGRLGSLYPSRFRPYFAKFSGLSTIWKVFAVVFHTVFGLSICEKFDTSAAFVDSNLKERYRQAALLMWRNHTDTKIVPRAEEQDTGGLSRRGKAFNRNQI